MNEKIILASRSPRRKQLLELAEIDFEIICADTDESYPTDLKVEDIPVHIALQKGLAIQRDYPNRKIVAADTVVVVGEKLLGKPKDENDAIEILQQLSGITHRVITGVAILENESQQTFYDITEVAFHPLTLEQITYYVQTYKPYDKAGAYAIQEWIGAVGIKSINGSFYNVMGLPISKLISFL